MHYTKEKLKSNGVEISRTFRNKKREYLKDKIKELETNNKNKILETCTAE
jgi:hypothetical protein